MDGSPRIAAMSTAGARRRRRARPRGRRPASSGRSRRHGDLDERAAGGTVVHRQPARRARPPSSCTSACRRVHEPVPDELGEHRVGVDTRRPLGGPLVGREQSGHGGRVRGRGQPRGEARREPVDGHVGVGHAHHSPTRAALDCTPDDEGGRRMDSGTDDRSQPSQETLTRNWDELLQEIRVTQTGVQILTGFLLTVPFSNRFDELTELPADVYLAVLAGSVLTTGLVVAPVAMHRVLFRQRRRELLVESGNRFAMAGLGDARADGLRGRAARRRRRRRHDRRAGSPAARSCSCSPCSGPCCPGSLDRVDDRRATRRPPPRTSPAADRRPTGLSRRGMPGRTTALGRLRVGSAADAVVQVHDVADPVDGHELEVARARRRAALGCRHRRATGCRNRCTSSTRPARKASAARVGPPMLTSRMLDALSCATAAGVERRDEPGAGRRDVLEGRGVDDLVGGPPDPGVLAHRPRHVAGGGLPEAHRLVEPPPEEVGADLALLGVDDLVQLVGGRGPARTRPRRR